MSSAPWQFKLTHVPNSQKKTISMNLESFHKIEFVCRASENGLKYKPGQIFMALPGPSTAVPKAGAQDEREGK